MDEHVEIRLIKDISGRRAVASATALIIGQSFLFLKLYEQEIGFSICCEMDRLLSLSIFSCM
jgi:hypothetical protein